MPSLAPQYDPKQHEATIYAQWEAAKAFQPSDTDVGKPPFVIMLPLPNITGSLHMGHALQHSIMDVLIRYHRMLGEPTLWQPGTDHAGIATQNVVEKELRKEGKSRHDLGREEFLKRVWQWREKYGNTIVEQMKRLGSSCDWSRAQFTMDPAYVRAVHETFLRYFERGYIYRGNRIVNWCPRCASVISDLEINHEKRTTTLVTLRYPLADGNGFIEVATTRPETMLGDTAVAVHTEDARYVKMIGQKVRLPLTGREVPIIGDARVEASFGTGAVKVTPAHDQFDAQLAETHHLPVLNVIGEDGRMAATAGAFAGQTTAEAREAIVAALKEQDAVVAEVPYEHEVALCERCGTVIEPLISRQWFVAMDKLKGETIEAVRQDLVTFAPARWREHFLEWMENVHDWTISRQLWWGQSIPVWWKPGVRGTEKEHEPGSFVVSVEKPEGEWEADPDVLDTWFSSALWPLATLGWPEATADLQRFYPTSVLATAREIVFLWVARMIFSGLELLKDEQYGRQSLAERIPFRQVFIHPTVLTRDGRRMSKSLGTGVDPLGLIDQYGADATRFGLLYQMTYDNQAIRFDERTVATARNFANKLWNIARLLLTLEEREEATLADAWIEARSQQVAGEVTQLLNQLRLGEAARVLHEFIWNDYADWYVEILKVNGSLVSAKRVFETILALLHPLMPHITEVLWAQFGHTDLLITGAWPAADTEIALVDFAAMERFKDIVSTIRSARVLLGIAPGATLTVAAEAVPLPEILAGVARVSVVAAATPEMKQFPLRLGGRIAIGGAAVSNDAIARAQERLGGEQTAANELLAHLQKTLKAMAGKASAQRVAAMEAEQAATERKLQEINQSLELLG